MKCNNINNIIISSYVILLYMSTLSRANDASSYLWGNYINESLSLPDSCKDDSVSLNFANSKINTIGSDFISSSLITCLNFTNNYITSLAQNAFRNLPNLTTLFLSNNDIDNYYLEGHENLKVLVMNKYRSYYDYNDCYPINQHIVGKYQNLEILSFSENCIQDLQWLQDLPSYQSYNLMSMLHQDIPFPKLKILDLSKNKISGNEFVTLLPRYGLNFLDLHKNSLSSLKLNEKGEDINTLILDDNRIEYVTWQSNEPSLDLIGMKTLVYLSIYNNRINNIQSNAFKDTDKLEFLNLSENAINTVYRDTFATLKYLSIVDLSYNQFKSIPQFSNELKISTMILHHNQISEITSNAFVQMPKLKKLLLGNNDIEWIDNKAFAQLFVLKKLDLSNNTLSFLPVGWTESLISLEHLDLRGNKFASLESLSLTSMIPLVDLYLVKNPLKYLNIKYFEYLPQNLTVHLT